jgi:hypothetical protein
LKTKVIKAPTAPHIEQVKTKSSDDDIDLIKNLKNDNFTTECLGLTNGKMKQIVIYEVSARRHFSRRSALFEARATEERVLHFCANVPNTFSRIKVRTIFFLNELCLICRIAFVNRMALIHALAKVSIELPNSDLFSLFRNFRHSNCRFVNQNLLLSSQIIFRNLKKAIAFWIILKH